jgi:hypothetical protein
MRVGSSNPINLYESTTSQNVATKGAAVENLVQSAPRTGTSATAMMKQAEAGIGSGLMADQLRNGFTDSLSLGEIFQRILDWIFGRKPQPQPEPGNATKLQITGDANFRQRAAQDLAKFAPGTTVDANGYVHEATNKVAGHQQGYQLINDLLNNPNKVTIQFVRNNAYTQSGAGATGTPKNPGSGSTATVAYDPNLKIALPTLGEDGVIRDEGISSEIVLAHELVHAAHAQRGTIDRGSADHFFTDGTKRYKENWRIEEFRTTGFAGFRQGNEPTENSIRAELGFRARATYLDRSGWTAVNGLTAPQPTVAAPARNMPANLIGNPWLPIRTSEI